MIVEACTSKLLAAGESEMIYLFYKRESNGSDVTTI